MKQQRARLFIAVLVCCSFFMVSTHANTSNQKAVEEMIPVASESAIVYDATNHQMLYEKNIDQKMYPASLTKMITVYVAMQLEEDHQRQITLTPEMFEGLLEENASMAGFSIGETLRFKDLLYGALLPSGAEACRALAITTSGSVDAFVDEMNQFAKKLGMKHTHFVNTSGLHDKKQYTTANDMRKFMEVALQDERFLEIYSCDIFVSQANEIHPYGVELSSTRNDEIEALGIAEDFFEGSKTGYTGEAGKCLATSRWDEDVHLIYVGFFASDQYDSHDHFQDAYRLLHYFSEHYRTHRIYRKGDLIADFSIQNALDQEAGTFYAAHDIKLYAPNEIETKKIKKQITPKESAFKAPYHKGDVLGKVSFVYDGVVYDELTLKAAEEITSHPFLYPFASIWWWISASWIRLTFVILMVVGLSLYGYRTYVIRKRRKQYRSRI